MPKYAVMIEVDHGEWMYVSGKNPFSYADKPVLFETREEAQEVANEWNTGWVVQYERE
jgi:hypothetical protein